MKTFCVYIILLFEFTSVFGQYGRLKGSDYVQAQLGFTDLGVMVAGRFVHNYQSQFAGEFGAGLTHGAVADVELTTAFADVIGSYGIYNKGRAFYINAQAGISFAGDFLNDFKTDKISRSSFFTYGVTCGLAVELKLIHPLSLILEGQQRYYIKPTFTEQSRWRFNASAGIRLSI